MPPFRCEHPSMNCYTNHKCRCDECKAIGAEWRREYRRRAPQIVRATSQRWALAHPENQKQRQRKYVLAPHGKARARAQNRRARELGAEGVMPPNARQLLVEAFGDLCLACGASGVRLEIDHVKPLALGGSNDMQNLQLLCRSCNAKKWIYEVDFRPLRTEN